MLAEVTNQTIAYRKDILDYINVVVMPFVLIMLPLLWNKISKAEAASSEAADSVRPNGTGHISLVSMHEDTLESLARQEVATQEHSEAAKELREAFIEHIHQDEEFMQEVAESFRQIRRVVEVAAEITEFPELAASVEDPFTNLTPVHLHDCPAGERCEVTPHVSEYLGLTET